MDDKVMVIRYDGKPPRQVEYDGKPVKWILDNEKFPVLITCSKHASKMISGNPNRYRLYRSSSIDIKVNKPDGRSVWETFNSWYYKRTTYQEGLDENKEAIVKWRTLWFEDKKGECIVTPTEEFITGIKKPVDDRTDELRLKRENEQLVGLNESLQKQVGALVEKIEAISLKVEAKNTKKGKYQKG